eukprot:c1007_g1_i1.p1 GENE.c1007_g1_i1~~c1007_g1_i1.p1  ORF type:complete len:386 (-),score=32.48 c1007_g1_i1:4-1161(-)
MPSCGTSWEQNECPVNALCVPNQRNDSYCDCRYSTSMFQNGEDGCERTGWTYAFVVFWGLITIIALRSVTLYGIRLHQIRLQGQFRCTNALGLAVLSTLTACAFLVLVGVWRVAFLLVTSQSSYDFVDSMFSICQGIYAFCLVVALICFGLSVLFILLKASSLTRSHQRIKHKLIIGSILMAVWLAAGLVPLTWLAVYAYAVGFVALWSLCVWILFYFLHRYLRAHLRDRHIQGGPVADVLASLNNISTMVLVGNTGFFLFSLLYILFWWFGTHHQSVILLAQLNAVAVVGQYSCLTFGTIVMLRSQIRLLKFKVVDRNRLFSGSTFLPPSKQQSLAIALYPTHPTSTPSSSILTEVCQSRDEFQNRPPPHPPTNTPAQVLEEPS